MEEGFRKGFDRERARNREADGNEIERQDQDPLFGWQPRLPYAADERAAEG